ncbi:P-loop containing nucleoside triphosphate hydrolase protein [Truncatella angustata]|uniref:Kinesin-like protein n=1 Tax=Truncatella angustata TaxID=152316 RepID=A0A9P8ZWU5_9PEZI|nr:P-loop containing nucleoside triphosphate hydrolase protein [Truncatella angustata]KAH6652338.1 P-loop containing nucleoside triphosphate hydrolase protein [Truncatella angustata]
MDTENSVVNKPSALPRLGASKLPQLFSSSTTSQPALHEITESQSNTRSQYAMGPPMKRGPHGLAQPEPKRKTLADKAGSEFPNATSRSGLVAPTPVRTAAVKGTSIKDMHSARPGTRSVASYNSSATRNTTNSSYATSIGPGGRPPSRTTTHSRSASVRSAAPKNGARPVTSMGVRSPEQTKNVWDVDERLGTFETEFKAMKEMISTSISGQKSLEENVAAVSKKADELEQIKTDLESSKSELQTKLDDAEQRIYCLTRELDDEKRARRNDAEDLMREHRNDIDKRSRDFNREKDELERALRKNIERVKEEMASNFAKQLGEAHMAFEELEKLLEEEKRIAAVKSEANGKDMEAQFVQLEQLRRERDESRRAEQDLKGLLSVREARIGDLERQVQAGQTALIHLKGDEQKQVENFRMIAEEKQLAEDQAAEAISQAEEFKAKLRVEERRRRKLFDQLQTLKGNIRVMCRIRPGRNDSGNAQIETEIGDYDDHIGRMKVMVPIKKYDGEQLVDKNFDFERVFVQQEGNKIVFEEISQLIQSALDGQKVCIFCYGQTGSGKTFTMSAEGDSIIPSAMKMIYEQAEALKDAGWTYKMWGSFTEVYNEKTYDLLSGDGTRNEVPLRQDPLTKKFYVDSSATLLQSPAEVESMLATANKNRTVAATQMNRASSRSHCVFTLRLEGIDIEGNRSEGVLNLIDLAGSERVKESQVEGQNFREAASINTSLSTLSKVMTALAENASHIPYRDSALTKLLEGCLGGNAKTLMFVMISPLATDIKETVSSLDFATTVSKAKPGQQGGALKTIKTGRSGLPKLR